MWIVIRGIERLTKLFGILGGYIIAPLMLAMVYEVISRKIFQSPTFWAYEVSYMLMGASFMFAIAYTLQMRRHIRVDFLYDHVNLKAQSVIDLAGFLILVIPAAGLIISGLWDYLVYAYTTGEQSGESAWNPIVWPFRTTFVIGFGLLFLQTIAELLKCILVLLGHDVPRPESSE